MDEVTRGVTRTKEWNIRKDRALRLNNRLVVPDIEPLKKEIMDKAHRIRYSVYPREIKMYKDLRR